MPGSRGQRPVVLSEELCSATPCGDTRPRPELDRIDAVVTIRECDSAAHLSAGYRFVTGDSGVRKASGYRDSQGGNPSPAGTLQIVLSVGLPALRQRAAGLRAIFAGLDRSAAAA